MLIVRTGLFLTDMRNINAPGIGTFPARGMRQADACGELSYLRRVLC
jgi:hypothetical protein